MPKVTQGASVALTANPQTAQGDAQESSDLELTIVDANDDVLDGFPVSAPAITHPGFGDYVYSFACPIDLPANQTLRAIWTGTGDTDEGPVYGEDLIVVLAHGTVIVDPVSVTTLEDVGALVKTTLSDDDLQALIIREEALLADEVGALTGSRVETFVITERTAGDPIRLRRPTGSVVVTEANVATTDVRLAPDGRSVDRITATGFGAMPWAGVVEITYTPNDLARITTWVIELVRARLTETGYDSETAGDYSYSRGTRSHRTVMRDAITDILGRKPPQRGGLHSLRLTTDYRTDDWLGGVRP